MTRRFHHRGHREHREEREEEGKKTTRRERDVMSQSNYEQKRDSWPIEAPPCRSKAEEEIGRLRTE
jgi:hypothetical protein